MAFKQGTLYGFKGASFSTIQTGSHNYVHIYQKPGGLGVGVGYGAS